MNLAQCANLDVESRALTNEVLREERRRCFWSICLLKRLHGGEFSLDLPEGGGPPFPESSSRPARMLSPVPSTPGVRRSELQDQGIIAYVIMLSEAFARTARYVRLRGRPGNVPPWSPHSEYSKIIALQMNLETRMPLTHRFKPANLGDRSSEELQAHREYWGPWFLNQFMYHTILCLLNHPLLLSLSLRTFRSTIPEIFLQHTSDLISSHTTWIIHFINYFTEKSFLVSDPLLGYSAAVVATIELQLSFTDDLTIRDEKRDRFTKCVKFVQQIGERWPHMARLVCSLLNNILQFYVHICSHCIITIGTKTAAPRGCRLSNLSVRPRCTKPEPPHRLISLLGNPRILIQQRCRFCPASIRRLAIYRPSTNGRRSLTDIPATCANSVDNTR